MKREMNDGSLRYRVWIKRTQRRRQIVAWALALVILICAHARAAAPATDGTSAAASPPPPPNQAAAEPAGSPIPNGPNVPTEKDFRKIYTEWLNRTIADHMLVTKDLLEQPFVRAAIDFLGSNSPDEAKADLVKQEQGFLLNKVQDPGLLFLMASVEPQPRHRQMAYEKAVELFPKSNYPKFIWFLAAVEGEGVNRDTKPGADEPADETSLEYLKEGLNDDSFKPDEMAALRWISRREAIHALYKRNEDQVTDLLNSSKLIAPWVREYIEGVHYLDEAWQARTGKAASEVTAAGWQGWSKNLALARQCLVKSWNDNPHDPAAAAVMVEICMGEQEQIDTMRTWFDRSVAADMDYLLPYQHLLWGMRPRWGGNYDEMNALGRECAATARYDTIVPYERVQVALDISDDSGDHGAQFKDPKIADEVMAVLNGYFAEPNPPIRVDFAHTLAAIVADKAGRPQEVKKQLEAINYMPVMDGRLKKMADLPKMALDAQGLGAQ